VIRNHSLLGNYDRLYQNFVPGAVNATGNQVTLTSYNNATDRTNFFNQTDVTSQVVTGGLRHTVLAGAEFGHQLTDNFRNTGFFNNATTSVLARFENPMIYTPVTYRQNATDADNHLTTNVAALYAQDQAGAAALILSRPARRNMNPEAVTQRLRRRLSSLSSSLIGRPFRECLPISSY